MSLLIDSDQVSAADLLALDPQVTAVATAASITLAGDEGILRQAWDEAKDDLLGCLQSIGGNIFVLPGTITQSGAFGANRPRVLPSQIVTTTNSYDRSATPLIRWMRYKALKLFYRAAMQRVDKDRYEKKFTSAKADEAERWRVLFENGIPYVALPLAAPGAVHDHQAGTFGAQANVETITGGGSGDFNCQVAITWVDSTYVSPTNTNNGESGPCAIFPFMLPGGSLLSVNLTGLTPPGSVTFNRGIADGLYPSRVATGWNLYVGAATGPLYLQNPTPLSLGGEAGINLSTFPALSGFQLQPGQAPDQTMTMQRTLILG